MPTDKDREFVKFLLASTLSGKMQWEPTAQQNQFTTTLQLKYKVFITSNGSFSLLLLTDDAAQQLVMISSLDMAEVEQLFEFVRRAALNVDSVLDDLMRGGQK